MSAIELCQKYQDAMSRKDLPALEELFTPDAVVNAPISGTANVRQFHSYLFANTKKTAARFGNAIRHRDKSNSITLPFSYILSIASGEVAVLNGITRFEFEENLQRFKEITFIYDPGELRHLMNEAGIAPPPSASV